MLRHQADVLAAVRLTPDQVEAAVQVGTLSLARGLCDMATGPRLLLTCHCREQVDG